MLTLAKAMTSPILLLAPLHMKLAVGLAYSTYVMRPSMAGLMGEFRAM